MGLWQYATVATHLLVCTSRMLAHIREYQSIMSMATIAYCLHLLLSRGFMRLYSASSDKWLLDARRRLTMTAVASIAAHAEPPLA